MNQPNRRSMNQSSMVGANVSLVEPDTNSTESARPITRSFAKMQQNTPPNSTPSLQILNNSSVNHLNLVNLIANRISPSQHTNPSCQKILVNEKPCNLLNILENSKITGRMPKSVTNLPDKTLVLISQRLNTHDYPLLIKRLDQSSVIINLRHESREAFDLMRILKKIEFRLTHYYQNSDGTNDSGREEFEVEMINLESAKMFREYGGIEIFKRILLMSLLITEGVSSGFGQVLDKERFEPVTPHPPTPPHDPLNSPFQSPSFSSVLNSFKTTKLTSVTPSTSNSRRHPTLNNNNNNEPKIKTNIVVENYSILKIKCKIIHILNRLVCLPHFGKLVVNDLLQINAKQCGASPKSYADSAHFDTILLQYLFSLLMFKDSRALACQLIESILLHMPMLNLNRISNMRYILENIDDEGLSSICRIFAVTLSDLDLNEKKYWANAQRRHQQQMQQQPPPKTPPPPPPPQSNEPNTSSNISNKKSTQLPLSIRDQNQELLINVPTLLVRLVNLIKCKDYAVRYPGTKSELEHWIQYIDEALSDSDDNEPEPNESETDMLMFDYSNETPVGFSLNSRHATENQLSQPALLAANKLNNFVHVLYTLSLLLVGKERKRVQRTLAKLRLASALNSLFDYLIWNCRCEYHNNGENNGQQQQQQQQPQLVRSHICPEVAVKIQFLRLVHSFCDHSDFKRVVLSKDEIEEILKYNREAHACLQVAESTLKVENRLRCTKKFTLMQPEEKIGLLSKIVQVIKQEPFSASFRFWLTRAIESFLRGGTSYADQLFLINRGIVEDTLQNILAINFTRPKEVLQSCFDMLGELVKFNAIGFDILDKQLDDPDKLNMLIRMINQSLVDSNMFLRSVYLSIEFFENNSSVLNFKIASNKLLSNYDSFERRIALLCRMINTINILNLSQENVSCLNTTLVILMLANRRNQLPQYLHAIKSKSIEMLLSNAEQMHQSAVLSNNSADLPAPSLLTFSAVNYPQTNPIATQPPADLLTNFRDLLIFWQGHYLQKDKDCIGLEQNSRIEFPYWKYTVALLLDSNQKNQCSLSYYMNKSFSCRPNDDDDEDENRSD